MELETNKGAGPDGIPPLILKNCSSAFALPLCLIFNISVTTCVFPDRWKLSNVTPIFKSGSRSDVTNYRGIAILSAIAKLFELLIYKNMYEELRCSISENQHGYVKGRSCVSNLLEYTSFILKSMEDGLQVDSIYTDFSKAFDRVRHQLILIKLALAVPPAECELLRSYFSGRTQRVKIGSCVSKEIKVTSGVPQGSHIGPLCFIWFVNDIAQIFKHVRVLFYADDMKLYLPVENSQDCLKIQSDLDRLTKWCEENSLPLNVNKCKILTFTRSLRPISVSYKLNGKTLERVSSMTDLGVVLDCKLSFREHIDSVVNKGSAMLGFIKRLSKEFRDPYTFKVLYTTYVRSKLEYACCVWQPFYVTHINRIERIQEKFIKHALKRLPWNPDLELPPYENRCRVLVLDTLNKMKDVARALLVFDLLSGKIDSPNLLTQIGLSVPSYQTRGREFLFVEFHRTNYGVFEPINAAVRGFNEFAGHFDFNLTRDVFINRIRAVT